MSTGEIVQLCSTLVGIGIFVGGMLALKSEVKEIKADVKEIKKDQQAQAIALATMQGANSSHVRERFENTVPGMPALRVVVDDKR